MGLRKYMLPCSHQIVREDELRSHHCVERQLRFARLGEEAKNAPRGSNEAPTEPPPSVERHGELYASLKPAKAIIVFCTNQRTVDSRGADLQRVGTGDRIGDVEKGGYRTAYRRTIIMCDRQIVKPFGHDLQRRSATAGHEHSHNAIPHRSERRLDQLRDPVPVNQEPRTSSGDYVTSGCVFATRVDARPGWSHLTKQPYR